MIANLEQLAARMAQAARGAEAARRAAEEARRRRREEDDRFVTGGVDWNGFSLKSLQRMVGDNANAAQLEMLADQWSRQGDKIGRAAEELSASLSRLLQYWTGSGSEQASMTVVRNAVWLTRLGSVAQQMSGPVEDAGGALRSAQSTMPGGNPSSPWLATAGGGAAAGFAVGGPIGAAFGAAIGGIASAFGFGSNKKKMKRKAVQTMTRFETAVLGIDGSTPRFDGPADGVDPGTNPAWTAPPVAGVPGQGVVPPGGPAHTPVNTTQPPVYGGGPGSGTTPSFAPSFGNGWEGRWQGLTGLGNGTAPGLGAGPGSGGIGSPGSLGPGGLPIGGARPGSGGARPGIPGVGRGGLPPGGHGGAGRPATGTGAPVGGGRGAAGGRDGGRAGAGRGPSGRLRGGAGMFTDEDEVRRRTGRAAGVRGGTLLPDGDEVKRDNRGGALVPGEEARRNGKPGRFGRATGFAESGHGYGTGAGANRDREDDREHKRRVPIEEDPFTTSDMRSAPPVIGG